MDRKSSPKVSNGGNIVTSKEGRERIQMQQGKTNDSSLGANFAFANQSNATDSEWTDFGTEKSGFSANPFRPKSSVVAETGEADSRQISKETTPANVKQSAETRMVDTVPQEDEPLDSFSQDKAVNFVPQTVARIMSEDTQDTNDTAPMSNRDPNRPPVHPSSPNASNLNLDAFCSKYFNTPAGQPMHSTGALGDWISPVESPLEEDEDEDENEQSEQIPEDFKKALEIPRMGVKLVRTASEASSLLGETLVEEKKTVDDGILPILPDTTLNADNASQQTPERGRSRTLIRPSQSPMHKDPLFVAETATVASASTFTTSRSNSPSDARPLTRHPFFWRTFPNVTVTSDDMQGDPQSSSLSAIQNSREADMAALAAVRQAVQEHLRQYTVQFINEDLPPGAECTPFVDQEVIKRLWLESRRQGTSAEAAITHRRKKLVESVTGVFNRNEYQPPENLNFAMG